VIASVVIEIPSFIRGYGGGRGGFPPRPDHHFPFGGDTGRGPSDARVNILLKQRPRRPVQMMIVPLLLSLGLLAMGIAGKIDL
jgi:hypothetical protein